MFLDPYKRCPCGSGKKVKFCCCKDIVRELNDVAHALDGEQRLAGLEKLNKLIAAKGERAALLALKSSVQMQLGEWEKAKSTVGTFVVQHPDNPVALAQSAMLEAAEQNYTKAVTALQRALEAVDETMPASVYEAIGVIGQSLLASGNILGGRGHLLLQASLGRGDDPRAVQLLLRIHSSAEIPLLLKQDFQFAKQPDNVCWGDQFGAAMKLTGRGAWLAALEKLETLAHDYPNEPTLLKNIGILRTYLGDPETIVPAWRRYARLDAIPLEEAVEAEALAQLIDPESVKEQVDVVRITYPIRDMEKLLERLAVDRRIARMPVDLRALATDDQPPPKGVYWLLDRPLPSSGKEITREAVPCVLGEVYVFGKQTDRNARLEFELSRTDDFDSKSAELRHLLGDLCGPAEDEEVTEQIGAVASSLTWDWRFPDDTPIELRVDLIAQQQRDVILNKWPEIPLSVLGGRRPSEVSADPAYRVRLLAAILLLELGSRSQGLAAMDFNELRTKLGLPVAGDIEPMDVSRIPLVRLSRVDAERLSDEDLLSCYTRAGRLGAIDALQRLAHEVVRRDSLCEKVSKVEAFEILARMTRDNEQAIGYMRQARQLAVAEGHSPATWLIAELALRLARGIVEECQGLVEQIQLRHIREPGVAQGLYDVLLRFGLIPPEGAPVGLPPELEPAGVLAGEPTSHVRTIWTPDSPAGHPPAGESKSKLWLPGQS